MAKRAGNGKRVTGGQGRARPQAGRAARGRPAAARRTGSPRLTDVPFAGAHAVQD